jgi:GNAT superfamily N-acetyltransferase
MASALKIRPIQAGDALAVTGLLGELGYAASERGVLDRIAQAGRGEGPVFTLVAETDGRLFGCVSGYVAPYFPRGILLCRVTALVVTSTHRARGIGKALMVAAAEHARNSGCAALEVTTSEDRATAHRFYESLGFAHTSRRYLREL